jgi:UDP-N-acetyl-D-mannosaminuronic acid transferase (WecB/TagA/CpsF family)
VDVCEGGGIFNAAIWENIPAGSNFRGTDRQKQWTTGWALKVGTGLLRVRPHSMPATTIAAAPATEKNFRQILGIRFYVGPLEGLLELTMKGGLIAVPSAPVLVRLPDDSAHREAVEGCDFAITDSGFLVLLWLLLKRERLIRISGLRFLQHLRRRPEFHVPGETFWVMPGAEDAIANRRWLSRQGIELQDSAVYLAPRYAPQGSLEDPTLLAALEKQRPRFVVLCLGGGVQERLGYYLRGKLSYTPAIVCTGAAIAFLSGQQANIPPWADRLFLGWLFRLVLDPARFLPRYWHALRLAPLLLRYRSKSVAP